MWETLSRDLLAIWEKMKQVLYPKYLLGGMMQRGGGIGAAERGEAEAEAAAQAQGFAGGIRSLAGRWPDADALLQSGMSEGLRDWDLWGPLIFCLLLSLFLSRGAKDSQKDLVFSGVFAMVWIGEAVVTLQIKLLGGNMYVALPCPAYTQRLLIPPQRLLPVRLHHWLHALPARHRVAAQRAGHTGHCQNPRLSRAHCLGARGRREHHGRLRRRQEPRGHCRVSSVCLLYCAGLHLLHQLARDFAGLVRVVGDYHVVLAWFHARRSYGRGHGHSRHEHGATCFPTLMFASCRRFFLLPLLSFNSANAPASRDAKDLHTRPSVQVLVLVVRFPTSSLALPSASTAKHHLDKGQQSCTSTPTHRPPHLESATNLFPPRLFLCRAISLSFSLAA